MKIRATTHSLDGIIGRLGIDPLEANRFLEEWLLTARVVTYKEATRVVSIFSRNKRDTYYLAPDPAVPGDEVVLIVRDGKVITVMTQLSNKLYGAEGEFNKGVRVIRTLEGEIIEDRTGWSKHLKRERRNHFKKSG